jgi:VacB/RNase II family 3'-5' exoribonuclease
MRRSDIADRQHLRAIAERAMTERGLLPEFSRAVRAETEAAEAASAGTDRSIRDLRDLLWCSIDNDDSLDLDQLTVAEPVGGERVRIRVAVADVDAVVPIGSAVDGHARTNTTSVYTAGGIFPMLPERLSTDLTSLGEEEDRLAIVVEATVDGEGTVGDAGLYRAAVLNHAKLAYNGVAAWLEGAAAAPARLAAVPGLDEQIRLQDRAARAMRALRHRQGALTLETIESRAVYDNDLLVDLAPDERNRARELIEDFMIAANGVTARFLEKKGYPSMRRVLREPRRWGRIVDLAATLGTRLPPQPDSRALEAFLAERRRADPELFPDLSLSVVKLLGSGEYALELPGRRAEGHFGLAVRDYSHSTAPNRRFPDLVSQRLVKAALAGRQAPYGVDQLKELASHCTEQEDNAAKVERQVHKSAAALLLAPRIGERFDAIVTGASERGTWARISRPPVEGKVVEGFAGLDVGDRVRVELAATDVERGFIDFVRV